MSKLKIALLQLNQTPGDISANVQKILKGAKKALDKGAKLIICPELSLCGCPLQGLICFPHFIKQIEAAGKNLARDFTEFGRDAALIVGSVGVDAKGHIFNQALFITAGAVKVMYNKRIPFADYAPAPLSGGENFCAVNEPLILDFAGFNLVLCIGEDIDRPDILPKAGLCDLIINISAPRFWPGRHRIIEARLQNIALKYGAHLIFVNQAGANDGLILAGGSLIFDKYGNIISKGKYFAEDLLIAELSSDWLNLKLGQEHKISAAEDLKKDRAIKNSHKKDYFEIWQALVLGLGDYVRKGGFSGVVLGLSGGIDSALVAALACEAVGAGKVTGLLMPSPWSSEHSITDAKTLAENLGMNTHTIAIEPAMQVFSSLFGPVIGDKPDLTLENLQARIRGIILMAFSNKFGALLLNTGNKSELAVGYCTLYGDMCGGLAVIADLYKTEVNALCRWRNERGEIFPQNILIKPPSAELRPNQKDEDSLPPYEILDKILAGLFSGQGAEDFLAAGFDKAVVEQVLSLVLASEFKRRQAAPKLIIKKESRDLPLPLISMRPYN